MFYLVVKLLSYTRALYQNFTGLQLQLAIMDIGQHKHVDTYV